MAEEDLEEGEIEEGEIVEQAPRPGPLPPCVPTETSPAAQAQTVSAHHPVGLTSPSSQLESGNPVACAIPTPSTAGVHASFASSSSRESAQALLATLLTPKPPAATSDVATPQRLPVTFVASTFGASELPVQRQQPLEKQPISSSSRPSSSEQERRHISSSGRTARDIAGKSRKASPVYRERFARSPGPPRSRSENRREREFREQQPSRSPVVPKSRSSSVEAGQLISGNGLPSTNVRVPEGGVSYRLGSSERAANKGGSHSGVSRSRNVLDQSKFSESSKAEHAARRQREDELIEKEWKERAERRRKRQKQEQDDREKREKEAAERRKKYREEREKREWANDASRLASDIKYLCEDCTIKDIMKSSDSVVSKLSSALRKLDSLHRLQGKMKRAGMAQVVDLAEPAAAILEGLRQLGVFSQTGAGQSALRAHEGARNLVRNAMRNRHEVCTTAQKAALEGLVKASSVFEVFLDNARPAVQTPKKAQGSSQVLASTIAPAQFPGLSGAHQPSVARKRLQPGAGDGEPKQSDSKRQRSDGDLSRNGAAPLSAENAGPPSGAAIVEPPDSPTSPPTPPPELGETELGEVAIADAASDLADSQDLYAHGVAGVGDEAVSTAAGDFLPFSPDTPPESPERSFPAADESAAATQRPSSGAQLAVPGLRAAPQQPWHSGAGLADCGSAQVLDASPAAAGGEQDAAERQPVGAGTIGRGLHSAYRESGPVGALLRQRRLCLVLDLDHTLVNSAKFSEVDAEHLKLLEKQLQREAALPAEERRLFRLEHIAMWTVLRPGVRQLLARVAPLFQLWIQTNASRAYALAVARLLDPTGELFGQRIISKGDDGSLLTNQSKRLMQGLEECEAVCLIVDDSNDVWRHHAHNLLHVERYIYFPSSRRHLNVHRPAFLEAQNDECAREGILAVTLGVLLEVHRAVFAALDAPPPPAGERPQEDWDVRHVLGLLRKQVLPGVRVLFSRVFPLDQAPAEHALWKLAETYGASCTTHLDDRVTHVVASSRGTHKAQWALHAGKHVVSPAWLECSCTLWRRAKESAFPAPP